MELNVQTARVEERDTFNLLSDQGVMKFDVTLSEASSEPVTVEYRTRQGTSAENDGYGGSSFGPVTGTLTFQPGETSKTVQIATIVGNLDETDEFFDLELFDPTGGATLAGGGLTLRATGWILNNDGSDDDRAFRVSDPVVLEGDTGLTPVMFQAELSRPSDTFITVPWTTASNTALAGEDFVEATGTFQFAPGQTRATAFVDVLGDEEVEPTETFFLIADTTGIAEINSGSAGAIGTATIIDDDAGPVTISIEDAWTRERDTSDLLSDQGMLRFVVMLSQPSTETVSVDYRAVPGTADASDFGVFGPPTEGTLVFEPGQTTGWINILTALDDEDEVDEALEMILSNPVGAVMAGGSTELTAVGWILDDNGSPQDRAIYAPDVTALAGDSDTSAAVFEVRLSRPSETPIEVAYNTADLTARAGQDYTASSGTITFIPGQTSAAIFVPLIGNPEAGSSSRDFLLNLMPDTDQVFSGVGFSVTGTILADDAVSNAPPTGTVEILGDPVAGETLTADTSTLDDANGLGELSFQWLRDGQEVSGATAPTYDVTEDDVGRTLQLRVSYTDGDGFAESVTSAATEAVADMEEDATLSGTVLDLSGRSMSSVTLTFTPAGEALEPRSIDTDPDGAFDLAGVSDLAGTLSADRAFDPEADGRPTANDALEVLRMAVGLDPSFGPAQAQNFIAADINGDGVITATDALEVLRAAVGLASEHAPRWVFFDAATDWEGLALSRTDTEVDAGILIDANSGDPDLAFTGILLGNIAEV